MKVKISQLSKTYPGGVQALRGVSLEIGAGAFGLLGPNGAGKTTLLRILATLLKPSQGRVTVDGFDVSDRRQNWAVKQILGYLPQEMGLYPSLTVSEFLDYIAMLKNLHQSQRRARALEQVVEQAGLNSVKHQRIGTLSGGMKRRVGIAQALLGDPKLLIVDEPTAGLDPEERMRFRNLLAHLSAERVILLSTHIVEDIAATCQDMAVLHLGQVRFRGSPALLIQEAEGRVWELELPAGQEPSPEWCIASRVQEDGEVKLRLVGENPAGSARPVRPTLEEAYLVLMGASRSVTTG
jgi:ABC-2 type transport system ATP-binding protein